MQSKINEEKKTQPQQCQIIIIPHIVKKRSS